MTTCPWCGGEIPETAKVCGWCGHHVGTEPETAPAEEADLATAPAESEPATSPVATTPPTAVAAAETTAVLPVAAVPAAVPGPAPAAEKAGWRSLIGYAGPLLLAVAVFLPWSVGSYGSGGFATLFPVTLFWDHYLSNPDLAMVASIGFALLVVTVAAAALVGRPRFGLWVRLLGLVDLLLVVGWLVKLADLLHMLNSDFSDLFDHVVRYGFWMALAGSLLMIVIGSGRNAKTTPTV